MPSIVERVKSQLEDQGDYVVLANAESGWFAINPNTWKKRIARSKALGHSGPNLIVYRTNSGEDRDHHVVPFDVISAILSPESLKLQKNGTYRWNLTLANDRLHLTHRKGYEPVDKYLAGRLIVEEKTTENEKDIAAERINLRTKTYEGVVEGIARESVVLSRSRSAALRREALKLSNGICEACGINYSCVLYGRGLRALQVHHKKQLALCETPEATSFEDLAVVCANCHAIIHANPKETMPVEQLREAWLQEHSGGA